MSVHHAYNTPEFSAHVKHYAKTIKGYKLYYHRQAPFIGWCPGPLAKLISTYEFNLRNVSPAIHREQRRGCRW